MSEQYMCSKCKSTYTPNTTRFQCDCGGILNLTGTVIPFKLDTIDTSQWSLFRYASFLPFQDDSHWKKLSMGAGMTPLIPMGDDQPEMLLKADYMMPTLSFKDRGAAVLIAKAKELGAKHIIQDSSGNAGAAVAAYSARAGLTCAIYVPDSTSDKKIKQIEAYGASVHKIPGSREDTASAALTAAENGEGFYASHVYNPYFHQGTKTYVYEIFEQLGGKLPEAIVTPLGNGTLLLGIYQGLKDLMTSGCIDAYPRLIAVQAEGCAPIYKAFISGAIHTEPVKNEGTDAEGIAIADPKRGDLILKAVKEIGGTIITAPEHRILHHHEELAKRGFHVEVTTAANFAGYEAYLEHNKKPISVVLPLCGAGLKSVK